MLSEWPTKYSMCAREFWFIYRGPDFLAVIWFGTLPNPFLLSRQQVVSLSVFGRAYCRERGRGSARSKKIRLRQSLALYKSFNTLWCVLSSDKYEISLFFNEFAHLFCSWLHVRLPVGPHVDLPAHLPFHLPVHMPVHLPVQLPVHLLVHLPVRLHVQLPVRPLAFWTRDRGLGNRTESKMDGFMYQKSLSRRNLWLRSILETTVSWPFCTRPMSRPLTFCDYFNKVNNNISWFFHSSFRDSISCSGNLKAQPCRVIIL